MTGFFRYCRLESELQRDKTKWAGKVRWFIISALPGSAVICHWTRKGDRPISSFTSRKRAAFIARAQGYTIINKEQK